MPHISTEIVNIMRLTKHHSACRQRR